ncbi:MAG: molecular chaperone TorD family protein [Halioglobus sp.]
MQPLELNVADRSSAYHFFADAFRYPQKTEDNEQQQLDYIACFDCSVYKSACSLHEAAYTTEGQEVLYEELTRFYEFFGLGRDQSADLPDHLSVELEFMHFLSYLEVQESTDVKARESLFKAQQDFLTRHLLNLVANIVRDFDSDSAHYRELLEDIQALMDYERAHFGLPVEDAA